VIEGHGITDHKSIVQLESVERSTSRILPCERATKYQLCVFLAMPPIDGRSRRYTKESQRPRLSTVLTACVIPAHSRDTTLRWRSVYVAPAPVYPQIRSRYCDHDGTRSRIRISVSSFRTSAYLRAKSERKNGEGDGRSGRAETRGVARSGLFAKMVARETRRSRKAGEAGWLAEG